MITLHSVSRSHGGGRVRLDALVSADEGIPVEFLMPAVRQTLPEGVGTLPPPGRQTVTFEFQFPRENEPEIDDVGDPFLPALLLPAMAAGVPLRCEVPISRHLLRQSWFVQRQFHFWYPDRLRPVHVEAPVREVLGTDPPRDRRAASFFSLGVDSFYTLLTSLSPGPGGEHLDPLTHLVYMRGLEVPLSWYRDGREGDVLRQIEEVARHYRVEFIVGETNLRDLFPLQWGPYYAGPGMAATALALRPWFTSVFFPGGNALDQVFPWSTTASCDPLWSHPHLQIFHHGADITRSGKIIGTVARDPFAFRRLRVCVANEGGGGNCGRCRKCLRTMLALHVDGRLSGCGVFPETFPEGFVEHLACGGAIERAYMLELCRLAEEANHQSPEIQALRDQLGHRES